jgi:hypothetical protein
MRPNYNLSLGCRLIVSVIALLWAISPTNSSAQLLDPSIGVTVKAGTTGIGIDLTKSIFQDLNVRAGYNRFDYNNTFREGGIRYDGDLKLESVPVFLDWHLFSSGFRLSAGAFYNNTQLDLDSISNTNVTVGGMTFNPH